MTNVAKFVLRFQPQLQPRKQSLENNENPKNKPQLLEKIDNVEPSPAFYCVPCGDLVFADRRPQISFYRDKPAAYFFMAMGLFFWGTSAILAFV